MKKITYAIGVAFTLLTTSNAVAQQGFGTNRPEKSAAVEIKSSNKGLLIPRISLTGVSDTSTINNPVNSLIIYNLSTTNGMREGYYYYSTTKTKWIPLLDSRDNLVDGSGTEIVTDTNGNLRVDLGGKLLKDVNLDVNQQNIFIKGLTQSKDLSEQVVAVGHYQSGKVEVATMKDVVTAGLDTPTLQIDNGSNLTVSQNGKESNAIDLKPIIQKDQIHYNLTSDSGTVSITPSKSGDTVTFNLEVLNANNLISVGNGIQKESNGRIILGGTLDTTTIIHTQGNDVKIQGLTQVDSMTNQMIAVGDAQSGLLKVASPEQIVAAGIKADNGVRIDTTTGSNVVKLGGELLEKTVIATNDTNTLAITGLKETQAGKLKVIAIDNNGVLTKTDIKTDNPVTFVTANYNVNIEEDETIIVNVGDANGAGKITITLPLAGDGIKGKTIIIKRMGSNEEKIVEIKAEAPATSSSGTVAGVIDGVTTPIESTLPYQSWVLKATGNGWYVIGH